MSILLYHCATAQTYTNKDSIHLNKTDTAKQIDAIDIISHLFKLHSSSRRDTGKILPGKLFLAFIPAIGYTLEAGFEGSIALNSSFYTSDQSHTNISVVYTLVQYSIDNQLTIPIFSSIWLKDNNYNLIGDWRFFSYPSTTYGLGSTSTLAKADKINYLYVEIHQEILRRFNSFYYGGIGYYYDYHWNIRDYTNITDFPQYNGNLTHTLSSGPVVRFKYDNVKNSNNPQGGFYASILYRYNSTLLGSISNWQMLSFEARKYFNLSHHVILAFWNIERFTFGGYVPYLDLPSNGFGTTHFTARGYIQGRFRGTDMLYNEGELRFPITKNGFLGGVVFVNTDCVSNWPVQNINAIFPGEGFGLRFKFNKFSGVNICADYAFGVEGSRGFFFNLGEVF